MVFISALPGKAQIITVTSAAASGSGEALADDFLFDTPAIVTEVCTLNDFTPGLYGNDYATFCYAHALDTGFLPSPHYVSSEFGSRALINGNNTSTIRIRWKNTGHNYSSTDAHFARVTSTLDFNVNMAVTSIPPGTNVTIYWGYDIFGGGSTSHEDPMLEEDSLRTTNSMVVDGVSQFNNNQFNFGSPAGLPGWNEWKNKTGSFRTTAGNDFTFSVSSFFIHHIDNPAGPGGFGWPVDQSDAIFKGEIYFSVVPQYYVPVDEDEMKILFSLDIGSDGEISDPQQNGNENFDPGDMYSMDNSPAPLLIPWLDDLQIFGHDPNPITVFPFNPAPVGSGLIPNSVEGNYFDLDGSDLVQVTLAGILPAPGDPSIAWFNDSCIFEAEYLYLSFDDDIPEHYTDASSVPVNSNSPGNQIYSESGAQDETMEFALDATPSSSPYFESNLISEQGFHAWLSPDPSGNNDFDDDIDALDIIPLTSSGSPCDQWYFSADHEALYNHPLLFPNFLLDPATIYTTSPAGPVPVIDSTNHGLPTGTDIDGFEFAWVWDAIESRYGLAMIFSVDDDDPLTAADESGNLDPRKIYFSFLNGSFQSFSTNPLQDDIDGLMVWSTSLAGATPFPNPVWGTKTWTGDVNARWQNALNWFPQGVPFDPEDVIIKPVSPQPVIGISGLDCRSLILDPGTSVELHPGNTFSILGP